jgi:UDP-GlcNAc:undecaprenyl-phosphate GlcNAc-1-phosphate transferase
MFGFSVLLTTILLKYLRTLGTNDSSNEIRWNSRKPLIGGITFYICFLLATLTLLYTLPDKDVFNFRQFYGIIIAVSLGFLTGLFDDAYNTIPWLKLALQILCGIILIATGTYIDVYNYDIVNYLLTLIWVVGIMNAINLLDNMDAISTIVSFFILIAMIFTVIIIPHFDNTYLWILIGVAVSLLGFLKFNWHPSKIYMGDTGSMFLGVFLAAFGILYFWNYSPEISKDIPALSRILIVVCIFSLPIIDTATVFIKRLFIQRKSPFIGGKDHTTHHLSYLGLNDRQVAIAFIGMSLFSAIMGLLAIINVPKWNVFYTIAFATYFILLFGSLFTISNLNTKRNESS